MQNPLTISNTTTAADLVAGFKVRKRALRHRPWVRPMILLALLAVSIAVVGAPFGRLTEFVVLTGRPLLFAFVLMPVLMAVLPSITIRNLVRANPFMTETHLLSFADSGIEWARATALTKYPWNALTTWIERPRLLVLNLNDRPDGAFMVICKGETDDATWAAVRGQIAANLGPAVG